MNIDDSVRNDYKHNGYALFKYDDRPVHSYPYDSPWLEDKRFATLYNRISSNTLLDRVRCYSLYLLAEQTHQLPGNILEVGSWRGGSAGLLALLAPTKTVYVADTFRGVVKASSWEHYANQAHDDTNVELVRTFLEEDLNLSNCQILEGVFPEETGARIEGHTLSLVHIDVDVYDSTRDAFNHIWNSLTPGGIIVFDDYGMISACGGVSKFVDEIRNDPDKLFIPNLNGQAYIIKQ